MSKPVTRKPNRLLELPDVERQLLEAYLTFGGHCHPAHYTPNDATGPQDTLEGIKIITYTDNAKMEIILPMEDVVTFALEHLL